MVFLTSFSKHLSLFVKFSFIFWSYLLLVSFVPTFLCGISDWNILSFSTLGFLTFPFGFHDLFNNIFSAFLISALLFSCISFFFFLPHLIPRDSRIHNLCIQFHGLVLANNTLLDCMLETWGIWLRSFSLISSPDVIFYFLIRTSETMLIGSVDFKVIWK